MTGHDGLLAVRAAAVNVARRLDLLTLGVLAAHPCAVMVVVGPVNLARTANERKVLSDETALE